LRNSASAGVWKKAVKQIAHGKRTRNGNEKPTPSRATSGIEPRSESLRNQNEGDNHQSNEGADQQRQDQKNLFLALAEKGVPLP
jgi:hypothetical protein